MTKTYKSGSVISFTVNYPSGGYEHVKFLPFSYGGGTFSTSNENLQKVLESLPEYGTKFVCISDEVAEPEEKETEPETKVLTKVEVNDIADAKQYLVDNYGIAKSKLRSTASINQIAEENGIEFVIG